MFTKINEILEEKDSITIRISKAGDYLAVSVLPDKNSLQAFQLKGSGEELDQHFHDELGKAMRVYTGFKSNLDELEKEAKEKLEEKKAKATKSKTVKKDEDEDEEDGEDNDNTETEKVAKVAKPVKAKKIPKDVERLIGQYTKATDADVKQFCQKSIQKKLEELKWTPEEIEQAFQSNNIVQNAEVSTNLFDANTTASEVKSETKADTIQEQSVIETKSQEPASGETDDLPFSLGVEDNSEFEKPEIPELNKNEEFKLGKSEINDGNDVMAEANFQAAIEQKPIESAPIESEFDDELF